MPSSAARRTTRIASLRSAGGPEIPSPVRRIAPNPIRGTTRSPRRTVPEAAAGAVMGRSGRRRHDDGPRLYYVEPHREDSGLRVVDGVGDRRRGHAPPELDGDLSWHATRRDRHRLSGLAEQAGERLADVAGPDHRCRHGVLLHSYPLPL